MPKKTKARAYIGNTKNGDAFLVIQAGMGSLYYPVSSYPCCVDAKVSEVKKVSKVFEMK